MRYGAEMPVNLSIKNAPDNIVENLKRRAKHNHRSLQGELMAIIEQASIETSPIASKPETGDEHRERLQRLNKSLEDLAAFRATLPMSSEDAVTSVRRMRDRDDDDS